MSTAFGPQMRALGKRADKMTAQAARLRRLSSEMLEDLSDPDRNVDAETKRLKRERAAEIIGKIQTTAANLPAPTLDANGILSIEGWDTGAEGDEPVGP